MKKTSTDKKKKNKSNTTTHDKALWVRTVIFFAVYLIVLCGVGFLLFARAGETGNVEITIYKDSLPEIEKTENQKSADASEEEDTDEDLSDNSALAEALHTTKAVRVSRIAYPEEKDEYNGLDLENNGATYAIKVNRQENIVTIYSLDEEGYYTVPVKAMCCSVSADDTTPVGLFTTSDKYDWALLQGGVYGQYAYKIYKGILFHSVPYTRYGNAYLETWEFNKLGEGASLGCVRLCVADAKWIYENCEVGTQVNIFDSDYYGPLGKPQPAYTFKDTDDTDWDPTDMKSGNPYAENAAIYGVSSHEISVGEPFDSMAGVMAFDSDMEDATSRLMVSGTVDNQTAGKYKLTYYFWDNGTKISKKIVITVSDSEAPIIEWAPETMHITGFDGDTEELAEFIFEYITAYDGEKEITEVTDEKPGDDIEAPACYINLGDVETSAGKYTATCMAYDAAGNTSDSIEIKIVIEE